MALASYVETIAYQTEDGTMKVADNIEVSVFTINSDGSQGPLAQLWSSRSGAGGGSPPANPLITPASGLVRFWVAGGDYDLGFHDLNPIPRIADITIGWQAQPARTDESIGFVVGDLKWSATESDHGRWMRCDGRELTQTDIEGALGLASGEGATIVTFLGTGGSSKYGNAASGKIKLPDARSSLAMAVGPGADHPGGLAAREYGDSGGVENVTLTAAQSGVAAHGHTATQTAHDHGGTSAAGAHAHGGQTDVSGAHAHTGLTQFSGDHFHGLKAGQSTNVATSAGTADRLIALRDNRTSNDPLIAPGPGEDAGRTTHSGDHQHTITPAPDHAHTINSQAAHTHTLSSVAPGITVTNATAANAASSHTNMPPFLTLGSVFLRV